MKRFVLDASVALRWFLDHPVPAYANRVKQLFLKGARAIVPALWHLEMANALSVAQRRSILSPADVDQALVNLEQFVLQAVETDSSGVSLRQACSQRASFRFLRTTRSTSNWRGEKECRWQPSISNFAPRPHRPTSNWFDNSRGIWLWLDLWANGSRFVSAATLRDFTDSDVRRR